MKTSVEKEPAGTGGPGNAVMRVRGLIRKEFFQILRDPSSMSIAFLMPVVLLLLFGYGVSLDAKNVDIGLVVEQPSAETADFTDLFSGSEYFNPIIFFNLQPAIDALMARRIKGIVHLRTDFVEQLKGPGSAPIQVLINGVDANTARLIAGYVNGVWTKWLQRQTSTGQALTLPVEVRQRIWFNPGLRSRNFLVPGLIAVIMTLIGALLTALVVAREWERGTMEALMVTPVPCGKSCSVNWSLLYSGNRRHAAFCGHGGLSLRCPPARLPMVLLRRVGPVSAGGPWEWVC